MVQQFVLEIELPPVQHLKKAKKQIFYGGQYELLFVPDGQTVDGQTDLDTVDGKTDREIDRQD